MLGSITYQALGISARRVLDFLNHEHLAHGGRENGNLAAPYLQLETWGVTPADIRQGFAELEAAGFVKTTYAAPRQANKGEPSRYALTWMPTCGTTPDDRKPGTEMPPTHAWLAVISRLQAERRGNFRAARQWLKSETAQYRRGAVEKTPINPSHEGPPTTHLSVPDIGIQ